MILINERKSKYKRKNKKYIIKIKIFLKNKKITIFLTFNNELKYLNFLIKITTINSYKIIENEKK